MRSTFGFFGTFFLICGLIKADGPETSSTSPSVDSGENVEGFGATKGRGPTGLLPIRTQLVGSDQGETHSPLISYVGKFVKNSDNDANKGVERVKDQGSLEMAAGVAVGGEIAGSRENKRYGNELVQETKPVREFNHHGHDGHREDRNEHRIIPRANVRDKVLNMDGNGRMGLNAALKTSGTGFRDAFRNTPLLNPGTVKLAGKGLRRDERIGDQGEIENHHNHGRLEHQDNHADAHGRDHSDSRNNSRGPNFQYSKQARNTLKRLTS